MYAVVRTGGKQYKVQPGDQLKVEKLAGDPGSTITLTEVLAVGRDNVIQLGTPLIEGTAVEATILRTARDRKVIVFKKKRRQGYHKKQGHRQWYTLLRIEGITSGQEKPAKQETKPESKEEPTSAAEDTKAAPTTKTTEEKSPAKDATKSAQKTKTSDDKVEKKSSKDKPKVTKTKGKKTEDKESKTQKTTSKAGKSDKTKTTKTKSSTSKSDSAEKKSKTKPRE